LWMSYAASRRSGSCDFVPDPLCSQAQHPTQVLRCHIYLANAIGLRTQVVVGKSLDSVFMVMEFMEHDLKQLMEDMPHPFTVAEV
jgi:hypothetical protein